MKAVVTQVIVGASPDDLFAELEVLDRYPPWMRLVHRVTPLAPDEGRPAWWVELRARVGPFTRSKQLRMVRTVHEPGRRARFERVPDDDRDHAEWILDASVADGLVAGPDGAGAEMTMGLEYTGQLWSAGVLGRILDDEIRRATAALEGRLGGVSPSAGAPPTPDRS